SAGSPRYAAWTSATSASTSSTSATRICRAPPLDRSKPSGIDGSELEHPELAVCDLGVVAPVREPLEQQVPAIGSLPIVQQAGRDRVGAAPERDGRVRVGEQVGGPRRMAGA